MRPYGGSGLTQGRLNTVSQDTPTIRILPDGMTAEARWRDIALVGNRGTDVHWDVGISEARYVKLGGDWKISDIRCHMVLSTAMAS
jgi:hypothetical protein